MKTCKGIPISISVKTTARRRSAELHFFQSAIKSRIAPLLPAHAAGAHSQPKETLRVYCIADLSLHWTFVSCVSTRPEPCRIRAKQNGAIVMLPGRPCWARLVNRANRLPPLVLGWRARGACGRVQVSNVRGPVVGGRGRPVR